MGDTGVDRSTYYDSKKRMTASLIRARKPYLWKNFFMGIALSGIATGIFVYTIKAIGTDEFEDVKPAPRRKPQE